MKSHNLQYSGAWRSIISLQGFFWTASGSCCAPLCGIVSGRRLCCPQLTLKKSHRHLKEDSCGVVGRFQEKLLHYYFKLLLSQNACSKLLKAPLQTIWTSLHTKWDVAGKEQQFSLWHWLIPLTSFVATECLLGFGLFLLSQARVQVRESKGGGGLL